MQLHFVGRNIEITQALKDFTNEKFKALEKRYQHINNVNIVFYVEHITQVVEATVHLNRTEIHATGKDADMYVAVDILVEKLLHQITKYKEKLIDGHR